MTDTQSTGIRRPPFPDPGPPLRAELLSVERASARAAEIGAAQKVRFDKARRGTIPLLELVEDASRHLAWCNEQLAAAAREQRAVSPAAEWLLDNYYLIESQVRTVREDLPPDYGLELPRLTAGEWAGYPRIYEAVVELVRHADARLEEDYVVRFVMGYQDTAPLAIGEVWAFPIMLRVALIENLRRISHRVATSQLAESAADDAADALLTAAQDAPEGVTWILSELDRLHPAEDTVFLRRLAQRLQGRESVTEQMASWLEGRVARTGRTFEEIVHAEQQEQAADQVAVANSITSVRFLEALDWHAFFETCSLVEQTLRNDPAGVYDCMDFRSRDRYRHALESMARRCTLTEIEVAEAAVSAALDHLSHEPSDQARGHVGWYLISGGRFEFERAIRYRPLTRERLYRGPLSYKGAIYWGVLYGLSVLLSFALAAFAAWRGVPPWAALVLMLLAVTPLSDLAINVVNRVAAWLWPPRVLPKLDFRKPIDSTHRTLVVIPALMSSASATQHVIDNLERAFLANPDPALRFAVLGDLKAAPERHQAADAAVIEAAVRGVQNLNERYLRESGFEPFLAFVRGRRLAATEGTWMGWERKRGALVELNRMLRGDTETSFEQVVGDTTAIADTTFVITLDSDTILPRDGAAKLVSTIAHPLNRAVFDPEARRVVAGYGLVQPRVGMSLPAAGRSFFAWLYSGVTGIDPYAGAVSDTYQDVFGEGSFTGKGIYEVDIFNAVLEGRIPENTLLSHDLLEGNYLRTALASDVEVFDDHPASYITQAARLHRWVRGDWQTLPWLMPFVRTAEGVEPNPLAWLHRWKILDNLRRSLFSPAMLVLIAGGLYLLADNTVTWALFMLAILFFPAYFSLADSVLFPPKTVSFNTSARTAWRDFGRDSARALLTLAMLPHQAWLHVDAVVRAVWRTTVSHRNLLEWETAAEVERRASSDLGGFIRRLWPASAVAVLLLVPAAVTDLGKLPALLPFALVWLAAPWLAWRVSRPTERLVGPPTERQRERLRRIARKTWRFYETFVTAEDNWLAPDNFQEDPKGEVAHRTSPTNVGLQLLSYLNAYDLGYIAPLDLYEHVRRTLNTLAGLDRFRGHFYNWYDSVTMQPLRPGYVSTVDSGNLAGHLLVLRLGLLETTEAPLLGPQLLDGLADTALLALEDLVAARDELGPAETLNSLRADVEELRRRVMLGEAPENLAEWLSLLHSLDDITAPMTARLEELHPSSTATGKPQAFTCLDRVGLSVHALVSAVMGPLRDVESHAPWAHLLTQVPVALRQCEQYADLCPLVEHTPSLVGLAEGLDRALAALAAVAADPPGESEAVRAEVAAWATGVADGIAEARPGCVLALASARLQADITREMWEHTDFAMLYDPSRQLFSIGFNSSEGRLDNSYYDMLASECRLASFLAVAKGDVPQDHWFRLGRQLTDTTGGHALVSWSASMFEYLMPMLVMRSWPETLLDETYHAVVKRQMEYGRQRGVPWGVSESAFNAKDVDLTYQYQAFGVPGLGLKRGLSEDVVIAPYASLLALQVDREAALANLDALRERAAEGWFGFYEAVDYTPARIPAGARRAVVKAYFAHHQGMGFVALGNELTDYRMRDRFHADPMVRSAELLLQERVPRHPQIARPHVEEVRFVRSVRELPPPLARSYEGVDTYTPATHFLSNGSYSVMVTNAGGGYSRRGETAVSRYREDVTRDCWGTFFFVRDLDSGEVWSVTHQPTGRDADEYLATFSEDKAEYWRVDGDITTHCEVAVSQEDDAEVRRLTFSNHARQPRRLEVTSYFEVALAPQAADQAHKAFSNLFVETESIPALDALLFSRRPRSAHEQRPWGFHVMACDEQCEWSCETDRARFIGRMRSIHAPAAMDAPGPLTGTTGAVLDPVCALRTEVTVAAGGTTRLAFATGVADDRQAAVSLVEKYRDTASAQRALDLAWTAGQVELRDLGISAEEAVVFQRLASRLLLTDPYSPLKRKTPVENGLRMDGLWSLGISGDLPILLVRIERLEETTLVRQALLAHQYWRHKGLVADLVVLNTRPTGYADELDERLKLLVRTGHALQLVDKPGGVFLRRADQMHPDVLNLLLSVARATLEGDGGPIALQLNQKGRRPELPARLVPTRPPAEDPAPVPERPALAFDNGFGGYDLERKEYVIVLDGHRATPAPWVNVIAGPSFGTMVSEAGIGCTWAENSHENRITTWNNDPVTDGSGEQTYIRDEETGEFWSPTALPVRSDGTYVARHGRGYSLFEHTSHGVRHELAWFAPPEDPMRIVRLRVSNVSDRPRRLSVTHMVEWVLGSSRSRANQQVVAWWDAESSMLTAHNHYNSDFPGRPAFLACDREVGSFTSSRTEFLGRNGSPSDPDALHRTHLSGCTGRYHDNCGALMVPLDLEPGESADVSFFLGQTHVLEQARYLVARYREPGAVEKALKAAAAVWSATLDAVEVHTPDPQLDALVNGHLLYQVLSCRFWGRTATYQSSGAFGFRDQLQDCLALLHTRPELVRAHIVEAARYQFPEGDVLHWWQPIAGRGVRTHFTDDRNWLPFVVAEYIRATGDTGVLDEVTRFIEGPPLPEGSEDLYLQPSVSERSATVYDHCRAALDRSRGLGPHGLPLIGGGDWNDGMNRVGIGGAGESVWLAWFLDVTMRRFADVCERKGDAEAAASYRAFAGQLVSAVELEGWDGAWYRRAYFDDGTPLGSRTSPECSIDAIAQAWAVISGAGDRARAMRALEAVGEKLVRWDDGLVMLLAPPFDRMPQDPGYIKGYVPGVRENGGQYTHAAVWVALAYLMLGDGDEALGLLDLINPINHALTTDAVETYKVEPYVVAADVYAVGPHVGRGGWTWYTGSAAWYYRVIVRHLLGLDVVTESDRTHLVIDPCVPKSWAEYTMRYRVERTVYEIEVANPRGVNRGVAYVELDGVRLPEPRVPIETDAGTRRVRVVMLGG